MNRFVLAITAMAVALSAFCAGSTGLAAQRKHGPQTPKPLPQIASLSLDWDCPHDPRLAKSPFPASGSYPLTLTFKPEPGSFVGIDDRALEPLVSALVASEVDALSCVYAATEQLKNKVEALCREAPLSSDSRCASARLEDLVAAKLWAATRQLGSFPRYPAYAALGDSPDAHQALVKANDDLFAKGSYSATSCAYTNPDWHVLSSREFINGWLMPGLAANPALAAPRSSCRPLILRLVAAGIEENQGRALKQCVGSSDSDARCKLLRDSAAALAGQIALLDPDSPYAPPADQRDRLLMADAWCVRTIADPADALTDIVNRLATVNACVVPSPGQSAPIDDVLLPQHHYLLERLKPATPARYSVRLNMNFTPPGKAEKMKHEYTKCLKDLNPLLWQPDGERMELSVMSNDEAKRYPDLANNIQLTDKSDLKRADSTDWPDITPWYVSTEESCPTIIHETMHILGLIDEYLETLQGYVVDKKTKEAKWVSDKADKVGYDCRYLGPGSSVMSNQYAALDRARDQKKPLLFPGQWRMITEPGCAVANKVYLGCGGRAYTTSKDAGGTGDCGPPLPECATTEWVRK